MKSISSVSGWSKDTHATFVLSSEAQTGVYTGLLRQIVLSLTKEKDVLRHHRDPQVLHPLFVRRRNLDINRTQGSSGRSKVRLPKDDRTDRGTQAFGSLREPLGRSYLRASIQ